MCRCERDRDRLLDVLEAGAAITEHLQRGPLSGGLVLDAVRVRLIEIGEAVKDLDRAAQPAALDSLAAGRLTMRNQLAHRYLNTSHAVVVHTVGPDPVELLAAPSSLPAVVDAQG